MNNVERKLRENNIKTMVYSGMSYVDIGYKYNISRQRVHQIFNGYTTKNNNLYRSNICHACNGSNGCGKLEVHHIDGNSKNNIGDNIITLCSICHKEYDKARRKINGVSRIDKIGMVDRKCIECGKDFRVKKSNKKIKFCSSACVGKSRKIIRSVEDQRKINNERVKKYYHSILKYKESFKLKTKERNQRHKDSLTEEQKELLKRRQSNWFKERYKDDEDFRKNYLKKQVEYQNKRYKLDSEHRSKILQRARERYKKSKLDKML